MEYFPEYFTPLTTALSLVIAIAVALFIKKFIFGSEKSQSKDADQDFAFEPRRDSEGRLQRRLGNMEKLMLSMGRMGPGSGIDVTVLLLDSRESLRREIVEKALELLAKKYALLRMKVEDRGDQGLYFVELDNENISSTIFHLEQTSAADWGHCFGEESKKPFDCFSGPLWRVLLLREVIDATGDYRNTLLFTFHHAICDGGAIMALYAQFIEYLNALHEGQDVQVEGMPLRPPFQQLVKHKMKTSVLEKIMFSLFPVIMKLKGSPKNSFLETFPPAIPDIATTEKKTCVIPKVITAEEMSKIAKLAKEQKCTIHGALTAAAHIAMAKTFCQGSDQQTVSLNTGLNVSGRKECQPEVKMDEFGCFITLLQVRLPASPADHSKGEFWKFAADCTKTIHKKIANNEHFNFVKMMGSIDFTSMEFGSTEQGRWDSVFNMSNRGRFDVGKDKDQWAFKFGGTYFAMAEQHIGPVYCNNVVSVNGSLYWGLVYYPHITTKKQAKEFINLALAILKDAAGI